MPRWDAYCEAAIVIAKTSEAALATCNKTDVDSYCGMFCREVRPADISDANARSAELRKSKRWLESRFSAKCASAEWNTPKKFRHDTPTAVLGERNRSEKESRLWHHMRAIGWFGD